MNPGRRVVLAYFGLFYFVPLIGNILFSDQLFTIYAVWPLTPYIVFLLVSTLALFLLVSLGRPLQIIPSRLFGVFPNAVAAVGGLYLRGRLLFALICLPMALLFLLSGESGFRYSYVGIVDAGATIVVVVIVLNLIATTDLFYCMFIRPYKRLPFLSRRRIEDFLLALGLVINANGTVGMVVGLLSLSYSLWPAWFSRNMFLPRNLGILAKARRSVVALAMAAALFVVAWLCGETIKKSTAERSNGLVEASMVTSSYVQETPELVEGYGYYLLSSFSSHYYSLLFSANAPPELLSAGEASALMHPLRSLAFRFDYLTGGRIGVARPEFGSLSRLNYTVLSAQSEISGRAGTSPGLIASFDYVFPFPLNVLVCVVYLCWIARVINRLLSSHQYESLSLVGLLILLFHVLVLFQSPIDFLLVFDNSVLYLLLLLGMALAPRTAVAIPIQTVVRPQRLVASLSTD